MRSPIFADEVEAHFSDRRLNRAFYIFVGVLGVVVLLWWPFSHFSYFLRFNGRPATFLFAVFTLLGFMLVFSIIQPESSKKASSGPEGWMKFAGVSPVRYFLESILFALFHTGIITIAGLPIIAASIAVSGIDITTGALSIAAIALFSYTIRMIQKINRSALPNRPVIRFSILLSVLLFYFLLSVRGLPYVNPVIALQSIIAGEGSTSLIEPNYGSASFRTASFTAFAFSAGISTAGYFTTLIFLGRSVRRRE